jgi:hypothetical protein
VKLNQKSQKCSFLNGRVASTLKDFRDQFTAWFVDIAMIFYTSTYRLFRKLATVDVRWLNGANIPLKVNCDGSTKFVIELLLNIELFDKLHAFDSLHEKRCRSSF